MFECVSFVTFIDLVQLLIMKNVVKGLFIILELVYLYFHVVPCIYADFI